MVNLLELYKSLERKIAKLEAKIERLERENESLKAENKTLKIENAELKEKLGLNLKIYYVINHISTKRLIFRKSSLM